MLIREPRSMKGTDYSVSVTVLPPRGMQSRFTLRQGQRFVARTGVREQVNHEAACGDIFHSSSL
jgi:hypothetical protein